jgi:hypothetical protein
MEARFAQLKAIIISMAAQMKSIAFRLGKLKDKENDQSYGLDADEGFFCGDSFLELVAPNEMMPHMPKDHESWVINDGNHVMDPNFSEMIFTTTPMIKVNTRVPKPQVMHPQSP